MTPELKAPISAIPLRHKRWFRRALVITGFGILILLLAAVMMLLSWLNSPEKALLEAADYAVKTPGTYHIVAKNTDMTLIAQDQQYAASGIFEGVKIDTVLYGSTLYVKSPEPDKLYGFFMGASPDATPAIVQKILPSIKDRWVSVNLNNVTLKSRNALTLQCIFQEKDTIAHDPDARGQWASLYLSHRFMDITATKQSDTTDYQVSIDKKTRTEFFAQLLETSFYQSLSSCSKDTDIFGSDDIASPVAKVTLTQEHMFKKAIINPQTSSPTTVTAEYGSVPSIIVPTDATSTDQLFIRYLQTLGTTIPQ